MRRDTTALVYLIVVVFSACTTADVPYSIPQERQKENIYYFPSTSNAPLLDKKNDLALTGNFSPGANHGTTEAQLAFAPLKNIGIMASTTFDFNTTDYVMGTTQALFGIGYMKQFSGNWQFETYGGFGGGKIINEHATGNSRINLREVFIQPAIAVSNNAKTLQAAFVSKFNTTRFRLVDTTFSNDRERFSANAIRSLVNNPNQVFWHPGVSLRVIGKNISANLNYSALANLSNVNFRRDGGHVSLGLGLMVNAGKK